MSQGLGGVNHHRGGGSWTGDLDPALPAGDRAGVARVSVRRYRARARHLRGGGKLGSEKGSTSFGGTWKGKEMFYLTTYSTHFIYSYMASDIW